MPKEITEAQRLQRSLAGKSGKPENRAFSRDPELARRAQAMRKTFGAGPGRPKKQVDEPS